MVAAAMPLLMGAQATAGAAATTGLIGAGGSFALMPALSTLSAGMGLFSAFSGMQAAKAESKQLKNEAIIERARASQEEAQRQQQLTSILNTQAAMFAGRGVSLDSGSALAISDFSKQEARRDTKTLAFNTSAKMANLSMQAGQAKARGTASLISGLGDFGMSIANRSIAARERQVTA